MTNDHLIQFPDGLRSPASLAIGGRLEVFCEGEEEEVQRHSHD